MDPLANFSQHSVALRTRLCDVHMSLGLALGALHNCEQSVAEHDHGEIGASAAIVQQHLEEMASMLDTAGEQLTAVCDKVAVVISRISEAHPIAPLAGLEEGVDNGVSYRVRDAKEGGAS